jgi:enoyl-[acyl-carrier-protein] reductase (NADH)
MKGKRGLIMGLANDKSLAWGIARKLHEQGAELAFSYQGEALEKRVRPLAASLGSDFLIECDVSSMEALDTAFETLATRWPTIDFLVHAIGFSDKTVAAEVSLVAPTWHPYKNAHGGAVSLIAAVKVDQTIVTDVTALPVVKAAEKKKQDWASTSSWSSIEITTAATLQVYLI